jgi:beta-mannosidase
MTYETPEFFALCDELGLMVWQDFMFANFDYPGSDAAFAELVRKEAVDLLESIQASPSLTVLCGGSEMFQQAAMLGMPKKFWSGAITDQIIPEIYEALRPDVIYVPNSPFGGAMPFSANEGVTHYYGVGAYCRPLDDARRADVRFSAESLAFSHIPEQETLDAHLPAAPVHDPAWKARVPRDRSSSWDFEDIREHYLELLYGVNATRLRREDIGRYLDLSRAVTVEIAEQTYAEWRRPGSRTAGALVWTLQDLLPGPGWGVIDATGLEKPIWHGLRRAFRPVQIMLIDEGVNGLHVHAVNETEAAVSARLSLSCLRAGQTQIVGGQAEFTLPPRGSASFAATDLFGAFFDTTYAFRFGAPAHDVTVGLLIDQNTGVELASAFHFPRGRVEAMHPATIAASLERISDGWALRLSADRLAQSVHLDLPGWAASDNWFHLPPGRERTILLRKRDASVNDPPSGVIASIGQGPTISL